jgi:hypothetical protein
MLLGSELYYHSTLICDQGDHEIGRVILCSPLRDFNSKVHREGAGENLNRNPGKSGPICFEVSGKGR